MKITVLCILLLVFFLLNVAFDLYQISNTRKQEWFNVIEKSQNSKSHEHLSIGHSAIYEEEVLSDEDTEVATDYQRIKELLKKYDISNGNATQAEYSTDAIKVDKSDQSI